MIVKIVSICHCWLTAVVSDDKVALMRDISCFSVWPKLQGLRCQRCSQVWLRKMWR